MAARASPVRSWQHRWSAYECAHERPRRRLRCTIAAQSACVSARRAIVRRGICSTMSVCSSSGRSRMRKPAAAVAPHGAEPPPALAGAARLSARRPSVRVHVSPTSAIGMRMDQIFRESGRRQDPLGRCEGLFLGRSKFRALFRGAGQRWMTALAMLQLLAMLQPQNTERVQSSSTCTSQRAHMHGTKRAHQCLDLMPSHRTSHRTSPLSTISHAHSPWSSTGV